MSNDYYQTKASVDEYIKHAEGINGADLIEKLKRFLPAGSKVLELGTGPGADWEILSADYQVTGSDFSKEFLKRLMLKEPNAEFLELDASSIITDKKFDCIYSNKVLHHLKDEELVKSINRQRKVLKPAGIVCHSFWKGQGSEVFNGLFVNNHQKEELISYFEVFFDMLLIELYTEFDSNDSILLIAQKKS
ncbi:MAG: methyltransferase domain-containing protein [Ekhidna sp.]